MFLRKIPPNAVWQKDRLIRLKTSRRNLGHQSEPAIKLPPLTFSKEKIRVNTPYTKLLKEGINLNENNSAIRGKLINSQLRILPKNLTRATEIAEKLIKNERGNGLG